MSAAVFLSSLALLSNSISYDYNLFYQRSEWALSFDYSNYARPTQSESSYNYGDAESYQFYNNENVNCFGYAIGIEAYIELGILYAVSNIDEAMYWNRVVPEVVSKARYYNVTLRVLSGLDDSIADDEYRVAFRVNLNGREMHFMRQNADGSWSAKYGEEPSVLFNPDCDYIPEIDEVWKRGYTYDSITTYFARR